MGKQRITLGSILEINIDGKYYVYAQVLGKSGYAFFDYKSINKLIDFSVLESAPVLFIISVYNDVITQGYWKKVGKMEIRDDLEVQPLQFIQDKINPQAFELYNPNTGEVMPANKEQCIGLECAAVWEAHHVEERIRDYYLGVNNIWLDKIKIM